MGKDSKMTYDEATVFMNKLYRSLNSIEGTLSRVTAMSDTWSGDSDIFTSNKIEESFVELIEGLNELKTELEDELEELKNKKVG